MLLGLEESGVAGLLRRSTCLYPATEILHITGFVILVGMAFVLDLRLLDLWRRLPIPQAVHHLTLWARRGLILVVPSGILLFMVDATTLAMNPAFQIKLPSAIPTHVPLAPESLLSQHYERTKARSDGRRPKWPPPGNCPGSSFGCWIPGRCGDNDPGTCHFSRA